MLIAAIGAGILALASPFLWAGYHWYAGQRDLKRYHSAEARAHFQACMRIWPWSRSARAHLLAARAARRDNDFVEADRLLHECQDRLKDESPESILEWALLQAAVGDPDRVAEQLRFQAAKNPANGPLVLEALAEGYGRTSRIFDALRCLDEWLAHEPDNVQALFLRGNLQRQVGSWQNAATNFRRVVELDPDRNEARWWLAISLSEIGRYEEAVNHLEVLLKAHYEDVEVRVRLAMCRQRLAQPREARALLEAVLAENPEHGVALRTRGEMAKLDGNLPEAEKWLREAIRVMPFDYKTHSWLTECLRSQDKTKEADELAARTEQIKERLQRQSEIMAHLLSAKPNDLALQCELGKLSIQLGQYEYGEGWLLNAERLDNNYLPALTALADYYKSQGNQEKAEAYRQRAQAAAEKSSESSTPK
jgi:tetratricopeptide (TPR) repeat protein